MKKNIAITIVLTVFLSLNASLSAQQKIYNEQANGMEQIKQAIEKARNENKYVFCQVGGNWCPWCLRFADFVQKDSAISRVIDKNFVYIHVNYSKDNKNPEAMKFLGNPARFGFPVFVIINGEGVPIHIQNSVYLEEGKGYNAKKVLEFFNIWTPEAVNTLK